MSKKKHNKNRSGAQKPHKSRKAEQKQLQNNEDAFTSSFSKPQKVVVIFLAFLLCASGIGMATTSIL